MKVILFLALTLCIDVAVSQMWDAVRPGGRGRGGGGGEGRGRLCGTSVCATGMRCINQAACANPPCPALETCISSQKREGTCPKQLPHKELMNRGGLKCVKVCEVDAQCMAGRKCCSYGCKRLCRKTVEYIKDGQCPVSNIVTRDIRCSNLTSCRGDGDCFWKKKCCRTDRCGRKCWMPVFPNRKMGQCPLSTLVSIGQVNQTCAADLCTTDADCPVHDKCCGRCPRQCSAPMRSIREGTCPQPLTNNMSDLTAQCTIPDACTVDLECPAGQKCCGQCPQKCTTPVHAPPAEFACPISSIYDTSMSCVLLTSCLLDTDCKTRERCCLTPCGLNCIVDVPTNTGPARNGPSINNSPGIGQQGQNRIPAMVRPGKRGRGRDREDQRRNRPKDSKRKMRLCGTSECARGMRCVKETQRCANPPCPPTRTCVSTVKREGRCPSKLPHKSLMNRGGLKCVKLCELDAQCVSGYKCCRYGCKRLCRKPIEYVKDGQCPVSNALNRNIKCRSLTKCRGDGDCLLEKKCCRTKRCGRKCLPAEFPNRKPGRCPISTLVSVTLANQTCAVDICTTDVDCPTHDKCCGRCPRRCIAPMRAIREGTCPETQANTTTDEATILACTIADECTVDSECSTGLKCCGRCPQRCTAPVTSPVADFSCPARSIYHTSMSCVLLTACLADSDCKTREKCCLTPCGKSCMVDFSINTVPASNESMTKNLSVTGHW